MRWLLPFALCGSGCFLRAQGGYSTSVPVSGAGGGVLEVSAGLGDLRSEPASILPEHSSLDVVGHVTTSGHRLGFGPSAMWVPLSGWKHDWSPTVRLGARVLQVEWLPALKPTGSVSGLAELGVLFFPSRATRSRTSFGASFGGELFLRYGLPVAPEVRLFLLLNVGLGNSIGPTS